MCIMSCLSCLESRPFWQHWKTLCLVSFVAGLRWFVHVHGSWITLQALQQMEWTLVWLQVKCLSWSSAGEMDVHQSDHLECHRSLKGHCFQLHHHLPAAVIPLGLIRRSCFPRLALSSCSPCSPLLSLSCLQAGCWHPHRGQVKPRTGGHCCLFLSLQVWEGGRMEPVGVTHFWRLKFHLL